MKPCLEKLYKYLKLEIERGYDNHAVMGGLERMLGHWVNEARLDGLSEDLLQFISSRIQDYSRLSPASRAETLEGIWKRIQRSEGISENLPVYDLPQIPPEEQKSIQSAQSELEAQNREAPPVAIENVVGPVEASPAPVAPVPAPQAPRPARPVSDVIQDLEPAALNAPVTVLNGVGPSYAKNLARLGIITLHDLLYFFPRRYDDFTLLKPVNRLQYGEEVTVIGTVQNVAIRSIRNGKDQIVEAVVSDGTGSLRITWFNNPWVGKRLNRGSHISLSGKIEQYLGRLVMNNPDWEPLEQQLLSTNRIVPVYPLTAGVTQRWLRKSMNQVVMYWAPRVKDPLPSSVRRSAELMDLSTAIVEAHFPDSWDELKAARQRLAFDEIFLLQLGVLKQKRNWQERTAESVPVSSEWLQEKLNILPYELTNAQKRVIEDIQHDLASGRPMNRLIQGDVGSGKTIVAALAIAMVTQSAAQAALMAPTSILAEQHYKNMLKTLADSGQDPSTDPVDASKSPSSILNPEEIRLMVGATPEAEKQEIRAGLESGLIKLLIGTHALIEDPVKFKHLQLVVIDEQHRFGVEQRAALRSKGDNPHLLVMTATPIPRSLALTIYGDLDLSVMDEMPPGRQPVATYVVLPRERERAYSLVASQVEQGRQAFIIYPLVEQGDSDEVIAAVEEHARLQAEAFPKLKLGLLHGRMRPDEKDEVMASFRDGQYHILVATSVVEVGVDVPNATVMLIEGANRFGLAQLHQLRGRVGRGADKSYCLLIPDHPDAAENERLQVMTETNDGFLLAERDLQQRGAGQFLGSRQSGFGDFKMANLTDVHLIEKARRQAQALFEQDWDLSQPENQLLKAVFERAWGETKGDIS